MGWGVFLALNYAALGEGWPRQSKTFILFNASIFALLLKRGTVTSPLDSQASTGVFLSMDGYQDWHFYGGMRAGMSFLPSRWHHICISLPKSDVPLPSNPVENYWNQETISSFYIHLGSGWETCGLFFEYFLWEMWQQVSQENLESKGAPPFLMIQSLDFSELEKNGVNLQRCPGKLSAMIAIFYTCSIWYY